MNDLIDWEQIKKDYDKGYTDQELADKYDIKKNTVTVKRNRSKWGKANRHKRYSHKVVTENKNDIVTKNYDDKSDKVTNKNDISLTDQQEAYCINRAKGYMPSEAYRMAYDPKFRNKPVSNTHSAYRLESKPQIKLQIDVLRKNRQKHFKWEKDTAVEEMKDMYYKSKMSVELFGITKSNTDSVYNAFDRLNQLIALDGLSELQREKLQVEIDIAKAKLKIINNDDNEAMEQANKTLDAIIGSIKKDGDHDEKKNPKKENKK